MEVNDSISTNQTYRYNTSNPYTIFEIHLNPSIVYCTADWKLFWDKFLIIYAPLKFMVCGSGIVTNIFNLIVFTRKHMCNSTNMILSSLAISDLLCMLRELETTLLQLFTRSSNLFGGRTTYGLALSEFIEEVALMVFHCWSTYFTLTVAAWRLICVAVPFKAKYWCTSKNAKKCIAAAVLFSCSLMVPMYWNSRISTKDGLSFTYGRPNEDLYLLIHAIGIKILPCFTLTIVSLTLIYFLLKAKRNRRELMKNGDPTNSVQGQVEFDKTTKMLVVIALLFLVSEFPFGLVNIVSVMIPYEFAVQCKFPLLALLNFCEYVSSSANIFIYLTMSQKYRNTFYLVFILPARNALRRLRTVTRRCIRRNRRN